MTHPGIFSIGDRPVCHHLRFLYPGRQ